MFVWNLEWNRNISERRFSCSITISHTLSKLLWHIILIGSNYKFHGALFGFIQSRGTLMRIKLANDVTRYIKFKWLSVHVCKIQGPNASSATDRYVVKYEMMHHFLSHQTGIALWNKILFSWNSRDQWPCENMILEYRFRVCGSWTKFAIYLFTVHTLVFNEISTLDTEPLLKACVPTYSCANTDYCKGN